MNILYDYALHFVGTPYIWAGNGPNGFDCSGFVCHLLQAGGLIAYEKDYTAQGLFELFKNQAQWNKYAFGSLCFYGQSLNVITHVAFCLDKNLSIQAVGGDKTTITAELAFKRNAFVKILPIVYRGDLQAVLAPYYRFL